jgi:hypothetical protein
MLIDVTWTTYRHVNEAAFRIAHGLYIYTHVLVVPRKVITRIHHIWLNDLDEKTIEGSNALQKDKMSTSLLETFGGLIDFGLCRWKLNLDFISCETTIHKKISNTIEGTSRNSTKILDIMVRPSSEPPDPDCHYKLWVNRLATRSRVLALDGIDSDMRTKDLKKLGESFHRHAIFLLELVRMYLMVYMLGPVETVELPLWSSLCAHASFEDGEKNN